MDSCKKTLVSILFGANVLFGCGKDCDYPEPVYSLGPQVFAAAERSSEYNVNKGVLVGQEVVPSISLYPYKGSGYDVPNSYGVQCNTNVSDTLFEFFIALMYPNGDYKFIVETEILRPEDFAGATEMRCSIHLPWLLDCGWKMHCVTEDYCFYEDYCMPEQDREYLGTVSAPINVGEGCFDWYYEDRYHEASVSR